MVLVLTRVRCCGVYQRPHKRDKQDSRHPGVFTSCCQPLRVMKLNVEPAFSRKHVCVRVLVLVKARVGCLHGRERLRRHKKQAKERRETLVRARVAGEGLRAHLASDPGQNLDPGQIQNFESVVFLCVLCR